MLREASLLLLNEEPSSGEHADASVRQLGLAPRADLLEGLAVKEVEGVKVLKRRNGARKTVAELARLVGSGGGRLDIAGI